MPNSRFSSDDLEIIPAGLHPLFAGEEIVVPSETHNPAINTSLRTLRQRLEDARPQAGESTELIERDVEKLEALLHRVAILLSPVQRLPPEVLGAIFEFCIAERSKHDWLPIPAQGPLWLARVCRAWREIAYSDPRLWTSISFYFPESTQSREGDVTRVRPALDLWLTKSASLPISLTFIDARSYDAATEDLISLLVDRLRTHSHRWRNITLKLSCGYFPLLFTFTPCHFPFLESFSISGDVLAQRILTTLHLNLESAPNLRLFIYTGPGQPVADRINLDWERLEDISLEFVQHNGPSSTLSRHFRHLAQCQNITSCSLGIGPPSRFGPQSGQTVTLPCLQTLRVRRLVSTSSARAIIDALILPQLETLEIDAALLVIWCHKWHDRQFGNLLARSRCDLKHLSIKDVDFPNEELIRCLVLSAHLQSLSFIPCPRSQDIRDILCKLDVPRIAGVGEGSGSGSGSGSGYGGVTPDTLPFILVPCLRELTLGCASESYFDPILDMLRWRVTYHGIEPLRRFKLVFFDLWHAADAGTGRGRTGRLERLDGFRERLDSLRSSVTREEAKERGRGVEALLEVVSPYFPEYVDPGSGSGGPE